MPLLKLWKTSVGFCAGRYVRLLRDKGETNTHNMFEVCVMLKRSVGALVIKKQNKKTG